MNKIIEYALSTAYSKEQSKAILEICLATGRPEYAVEKVLGIDEPAVINPTAHEKCEMSFIDKEFTSYDVWKDRVHFKAKRNRALDGEPPVYKETESYCSLKSWNEGGW